MRLMLRCLRIKELATSFVSSRDDSILVNAEEEDSLRQCILKMISKDTKEIYLLRLSSTNPLHRP